MINPAIEAFPEHQRLVGAMVVGYGELDISMTLTVGDAVRLRNELLKGLEPVFSERTRAEVLRGIGAAAFEALNLTAESNRTFAALAICRGIRNLYAHCHWLDYSGALYLTKIDWIVPEGFEQSQWAEVPLGLLQRQEAYFEYTRKLLMTLAHLVLSAKARRPPQFLMPVATPEPMKHTQKRSLSFPSRSPGPIPHPE